MEDLLVNEEALTKAFIPSRLLHGKGQLRQLEQCLALAFENKCIENVFLVGPSGTGKTSVAKWILGEYFATSSVYVNCWNLRTSHEILREVLLAFRIPVHGRDPTGELLRRLQVIATKKKVIICLDKVDRLADYDLLYSLSRNSIGLIFASTRFHAFIHMSSRIRSGLALSEIEFPSYSTSDLFGILKQRVEFALRPSAISDELTRVVASSSGGDARVGLEILRRAATKADHKALPNVSLEVVKEAVAEAIKLKRIDLLSEMNEHQRIIFEIFSNVLRIKSENLYNKYRLKVSMPVVDKAYRKYMRGLVDSGLVKEKGKVRWKVSEVFSHVA